ncbi:MAG: GAF domain-containing protein [Sandaracinaceae bacterium]|nr:GAF domain-containing protein [Sandaracinaceae bacterium]
MHPHSTECPYSESVNPLSFDARTEERRVRYRDVRESLRALLLGESDWIAAMATTACELHHAFVYFDWTGFYRAVDGQTLVLGPYQGGHGCLRIELTRGVCGAAARTRTTQLVDDVSAREDHIACSTSTQSEIVVPIIAPTGRLLAVLDVDSNTRAAFGVIDREELEAICSMLAAQFANTALL